MILDDFNGPAFPFVSLRRRRVNIHAAAPRMASLREIGEERRKQWHGMPPGEIKPDQQIWRAGEIKF